jgi:hypothetical protein
VPVASPVHIIFEYDYRLLHRWLLKVTYNFARATGLRTDIFLPHLPYILGKELEAKANSALLVGVFEASEARPHEIAAGFPRTFAPFVHSIGEIKFSNVRWVRGCLSFAYCVSVASFCFQVIDFCDVTPRELRSEILNQILMETQFFLIEPRYRKLLINRSVTSARDFLFNEERVEAGIYRFSGA